MSEILDVSLSIEKNEISQRLLSSIQWWEGMRLKYTLAILLSCIGFIISDSPNFTWNSTSSFQTVFWVIGANIFYFVGWGIEILIIYYSKKIDYEENWIEEFIKHNRMALFTLGFFFSVFVTWNMVNTI